MKLRLATWILSCATLLSPTANAASVRGKDHSASNQKRRVLQASQAATYLIQDIQYDQYDSGRRLSVFEGRPEKLDTVELANGLIYTVNGFIPPGWTVSGQGVRLPPSTIIDDDTATITLPNEASGRHLEGDSDVPEAVYSLTEEQERNLSELHRQLAVVTGDKTVLAVKVVASDGAYGFDPSYLECKVFGTSNGSGCGDTYHLANGYRACSYDKLRFNKASTRTSGSATVSNISNGVVTVTLPSTSTTDGDGVMRNAVTSALNTAFGTASGLADHLMYCLPPNTMNGIAYAYINSWNSVYSNNWCNNVSAQLHEIGHNLNLAHSNEGTTTYADQSGMMGYSYGSESTPVMCFNAAKNYQLGWYSDKTVVVTPGAVDDNCFAGNLYGTAKYGDAAAETVGIKVNNSGSSTDVYMMFNAKTGIQSGTVEGGNQVMVVTAGAEGTGYAESTLVQKISTNTAGYALPGFANTVLYVDSKVDGSHASIRIETNGQSCVPPAPTPPPSPQPTNNPTTAAPTNVPTSEPTNPPPPPTFPPTKQPTNAPTAPQPTSSPTPLPTSAPVASVEKYVCAKNQPLPATICADGRLAGGDCSTAGSNNSCGNGRKRCWWASCPGSPPGPTPAPVNAPSPPTGCSICGATGEPCCGTCVNKGNPSRRGCFL